MFRLMVVLALSLAPGLALTLAFPGAWVAQAQVVHQGGGDAGAPNN